MNVTKSIWRLYPPYSADLRHDDLIQLPISPYSILGHRPDSVVESLIVQSILKGQHSTGWYGL